MKFSLKTEHYTFVRLQMTAGVTAISFSPLAVKVVAFSPTVSAFYRSFYAAIFFLIAALCFTSVKQAFDSPRWIGPSVLAGIFLGIDLVVWHKTIIYLGAGPATFLGNSQIIFVALFAVFVFREKIRPAYCIFVGIILAGLYMLLPPETTGVSKPVGYMMGLVVGLTYAGMLLALRYAKMNAENRYPQLLSLACVYVFSALVAGGYTLLVEKNSLLNGDLQSHVFMALTAFGCQTLGWFLINRNLTRMDAHEGSFLLMLQPVLATLWGCLCFSEPLSSVQFSGMTLSLGGILIYQLKYAPKPQTAQVRGRK